MCYDIDLHHEKNKSRTKASIPVIIENKKKKDTNMFDANTYLHDFYYSRTSQRWKLKTVFEIICYFGINIILLDRLLPSRSRSKSFLFEVDPTSYIISWFIRMLISYLGLFAVVHNEFWAKILIFRFRLIL